MNFVHASLKYKQVTITVLLFMFAVGVYALLNMPRREDPKITIRQGLVVVYFPGATSEQVEEQVTKKMEQYLFQFEEVRKDKTFSISKDGMAIITVELTDNVKTPDVFWGKLRQRFAQGKQVDFPEGVVGPIVNSDFGDTEAMIIGIKSDSASYSELKDYSQKLEDRIRTIKSVSKVKRIGEQQEQIVVSSSSQKLSQYGVKLETVVKLLQSQNAINATGNLKTDYNKTPLYTKGYYNTENEIGNQIVGVGRFGGVIRIRDVADLSREYAEPGTVTTVNGTKAILLAVQMQEGNNIVKFGEEVEKIVTETSKTLPSKVELTAIVNQPHVVDHDVSHFIDEFLLAILSVVVVVLLMLPFRVALVAAMAIPMSVALTFGLMQAFGIELHQVSLAALIVVLGMVVDDAIVVADNYIELLDAGVERWTAAWRSASDLVIPVLAATVTIIASFLPMIIIAGTVGEFIHALPLTVAIALASSFIVAMVLTPILCYTFIKKGLHQQQPGTAGENGNSDEQNKKPAKKKKFNLLDKMQAAYNRAIDKCVKYPKTTILLSLLTIVFAGLLYQNGIRQKFFPTAERNQFVIDLWMPTNTKLEKTQQGILKVEALVKQDKRTSDYATFVGTSAPRFYYNFGTEVPTTNFAQILVNTTDNKAAESLAAELSGKVDALVPDARVQVRLLQQGAPLKAPVEVRVKGDDIARLKEIGIQIQNIVKNTKGSLLVRSDFKEDYYGIEIQMKEEGKRLGFTTESIAKLVYTGFAGAPVTTMYEGSTPINILLRLNEQNRQTTTNLENLYITSPITGAYVPLRQAADLKPSWHTGNIAHRNGIRTLTVQSETAPDVLPSQLLKEIQPQVEKLQLPVGYSIEYGGEYGNKQETFSDLVNVLLISLVLIFLILLLQFKNLKEAIIVMLSIPLSLFGALLGLYITGNYFSFTAFIGLISLSGIVVRNAIMIVDYTNELIKHGADIRTAALESGKRRLRPIFLTAMAAAIGVLPMILSGSPMWSPLASIIAVGVLWGMIMAVFTVPVMYISWIKAKDKKN